ncbi:hypothetical protein FRC19_010726 [Serendipita sp. 401]|nr:hypothetical protein FRC19_010726 [Serendipita sp. 401]
MERQTANTQQSIASSEQNTEMGWLNHGSPNQWLLIASDGRHCPNEENRFSGGALSLVGVRIKAQLAPPPPTASPPTPAPAPPFTLLRFPSYAAALSPLTTTR